MTVGLADILGDLIADPSDIIEVVVQDEVGRPGLAKLYIHANGRTVVRLCKANSLTVTDERVKRIRPPRPLRVRRTKP